MASKFTTVNEVRGFFEQCKGFWLRQGCSEAVAICKAFWWDIVEVSNSFDAWGTAKEQFAMEYAGYKIGDPLPSEADVEAGTCVPKKFAR